DNSRGVSLAYAMYSASKFTPILTKIQVLCEELAMTDEKFKGIMKNALEKETADITPDGSFGPQSKKLILAYLKYRNHPLKNTFASAWDSIEQKPDEGARQFAERRDTEHMALLSRVADSVSKSWDMQKDTLKLRLGNLNDKKTLKQFFENRYSACWRMCDQLLKALCPSRVVGEDGKVRYGSDSERVMGERLHSLADAYLTKRTGSFLDIITDERELQEMFPEAKINFELRLKTAISQALEYDALRRGFLPMHHYSGKMLGFGVDKDIAAKIVKMQSLIH
ncbi:MAG TPA: hypothetical protein VEA59_05755, partial [Patescibacteria group bacterium]|nr:hypothetical protein [Patescibacteria group bacterium]